jgi:hypothetical protein
VVAPSVHTELHHRLVDAIDMPRLARTELATPALDRMTLNGVLATNRWLQPELLGSLGVLELQAGRAAVVVGARTPGRHRGCARLHRSTPRPTAHGKDWLDRVVEPLASIRRGPPHGRRGAVAHAVNDRFFRWWQQEQPA